MISRLIVEGDRLKWLAIERMDKSATTPLEISSRSDRVRANLDRLRMAGRMPSVGANILKIEEEGRSNNRPIEVRGSPFFQRSHISSFCAEVYLIRVLYDIVNTPSFYLKIIVLRRSVETAIESRR